MRLATGLGALFLLLSIIIPASAQQLSPGEKLVRDNYYLGDRELVVLDGKPFVDQKNASLRLRAFYFTQAAGTPGIEWSWDLMPVLEGMKKEAPNDPWTLVAQSMNAPSTAERLALCKRAVAASSDPDLVILCTDSLVFPLALNRPGADADDVAAFLGAYGERLEGSADGLCAKAIAIYWVANRRKDKKADELFFEALDKALRIDPRHERTLSFKAGHMVGQKRFNEVTEMLEPVLSTGAKSVALHRPYMNSVNQMDLPREEKARLMEADMMRLLDNRLPGPSLLSNFCGWLRANSDDAARRIAESIMKRYPNTYGAEMTKVALMTAKVDTYGVSEIKPDDLRKETGDALMSYLMSVRAGAESGNLALFMGMEAADSGLRRTFIGAQGPDGIEIDQLWRALTALHNDYARSVIALELLKRRAYIAEIRTRASSIIDRLTAKMRSSTAEWRLILKGEDREESDWETLSRWYQVAGYADMLAGNVAGAERNLLLAEKLNPYAATDLVLGVHLAEVEIAKKEFDRAEQRLTKALDMNWTRNSEHPALTAFRSLYKAKNKNAAGLEPYMAALLEKDRVKRKTRVLGGRLKDPREHPAFALKTHDGKPLSSADLKGKVTVINFWGVWCAPCVLEMPEMQRLYDRYKDDPRVAIVTIDSGDTLTTLKTYLERNRYTFPVLREGEYVKTADIKSFPTTWFLDADGRIAFIKLGRTIDLEAEFGWRIEALLGTAK